MVAMFLGALDGTIVTTAVPTIVKELNGFAMISWVFSAYLFASAISTPIYGKLADLFGRKKIFLIGISIFLLGSMLSGLAQNMLQLIIFRVIQGLGTGAIFTLTYTIVGDIFALDERAKVQGWLAAVWGLAGLLGPLIGGFMIATISWHWIFFINLPFGLISIVLLKSNLEENIKHKAVKIDYAGILVLSLAIFMILFGMMQNDSTTLISPKLISFLLTGVAFLFVFYFIERKAEEPIFPFKIFSKSNIFSNLNFFFCSTIMIGVNVYLPFYIQNVLGFSPLISGLSISGITITWLLATIILAKALIKYGEGRITLLSSLILLLGCLLLLTINTQTSLLLIVLYTAIIGFALGGIMTILLIVIQESVSYELRGAATAVSSLVKTLGQTIGISVLGSLFNIYFIKYFLQQGIIGVQLDNLYGEYAKNLGLNSTNIQAAFNASIHKIFIILVLLAIPAVILTAKLPNNLKRVVR